MKLGVYGGTFDPIHLAHLIIAEFARDKFNLDKVLFIPSFISPHKTNTKISSASHRLAMLNLAVSSDEKFEICEFEINSQRTSYTVATLDYLHKIYKLSREDLYLIIGADNMKDFDRWKEPERIAEMAQLVVAGRSSAELAGGQYPAIHLDFPLLDISSSFIRTRIGQGKSVKYLLPASVEAYIHEYNLYR